MIKTAFIILHYQSSEDTLKCIESIKKMEDFEQIGIVLIDNASPNKSGDKLREKFADDENIIVILNDTNAGFSHANNIGCDYAIKNWNPDFLVVANNDIVFTQSNFCTLVRNKYTEKAFSVLGPDILNLRTGKHQSPMGTKAPTLERSLKTIRLNALCLKFYGLTYPLMRLWFKRLSTNATDARDYDAEQENVYVQGACVIFSKDYFGGKTTVYEPETFFFAEEAIFTKWCELNSKRTLYSPDIKVLHNESASTLSEQDMKKRIRFQMTNILEATTIYVDFLKKNS